VARLLRLLWTAIRLKATRINLELLLISFHVRIWVKTWFWTMLGRGPRRR
jgi:hypothetical protein